MPGSLSHLTRRFFDVLLARPLDGAERAAVEGWLAPVAAEIFFAQPGPDQRHAYHSAMIVLAFVQTDVSVLRAALLHDVGKRHAGLGVIGRVIASLLIRLGLPLTDRARRYRDHGEVAAAELEAAGLEPIVVEFARHHHGSRPAGIPEATWELLRRADEPPKAGHAVRARIT